MKNGDYTTEEILRLDEPKRVLISGLLSGQSYRALSATHNIPIGTVKSRINRARAKIEKNRAKMMAGLT